ncbi:MAG: LamG domain-containing protein [Candidatus Marithrix sp.]
MPWDLDNYVDLGDSVTNMANANFSLEAWIKTTATSQGIIVKNNGDSSWETGEKSFYINDNNKVSFVGFSNSYITGTTDVNDDRWHHVAVIWDEDNGTGYIYVDGTDDTAAVPIRLTLRIIATTR